MKNYIIADEWSVIEEGFHADYNEMTESLMSLGNGRMGQRGNFEETFSGKTLQGNYVAGVYFPDKTRVGWWKNGYPNYFAKVLNACNWIGINVQINGEELDLATVQIESFRRELNMKEGVLYRIATVVMPSGVRVQIKTERFTSMEEDEIGAISYSLLVEDETVTISLNPYLDGGIRNKDSNYNETFWEELHKETNFSEGYLLLQTKENPYGVERFQVATGMAYDVWLNELRIEHTAIPHRREKYVSSETQVEVPAGKRLTLFKYATNVSSMNYAVDELVPTAKQVVAKAIKTGYATLKAAHLEKWESKWQRNDIMINRDVAAQQGIRFNIFHLEQTYTGADARLNIGPKGFTGEKYGGSTYWDTEAYCLPFYLATADQEVAKNLLVYRFKHLSKAIENAEKLGFTCGAALYPMVTMNGEECHNEWEITFEEIHRNGAIAYAIFDYVRYTNDHAYLAEYGLQVLIGISRFWSQRFNWSKNLEKFVMLGVTGPNEYENNVNNNWYTNYIANWTLRYTLEVLAEVKDKNLERYEAIVAETGFNLVDEPIYWTAIIENTYFPYDEKTQLILQQQGFLDKELLTVEDIAEHRPINQKWSWDRILRSCFIKQADVLQGMYFFEEDFTKEEIERHFKFYEPMTVHESSLSPCVHAILAAKLNRPEKAYEMYLRTARLDLDDYNNDTEDGLHITSMAGTWMSIVKGFAGQRIKEGVLSFEPFVPDQWSSYSFRIGFRGTTIQVNVDKSAIHVERIDGPSIQIYVGSELQEI